jgi:two-component system, NtrC family, sensor kinase
MSFKQLKGYERVGTKIGTLTSFVVLALLGANIYMSIRTQRKELMHEAILSASRLSETIQLSSRSDMLLHAADRLHQFVDSLARQPSVQKIRVFNSSGHITYSSDDSEENSLFDKHAEPCHGCHAASKPAERLGIPERTRILTSPAGHRVLGMITPIGNEPDCYSATCHVHSSEQKVLGVLDVELSLQPIDERIRRTEVRTFYTAMASAVALVALIAFIVNRFLSRPLKALMEVSRHVADEESDIPIRIPTDDEFGTVAQFCTQLAQDLKRARSSLTQWGCRFEEMVCERTRNLQETQHQLIQSEKLASLGKLSAGIAHEINNPLTGILNLSQLLQDQFPPESEVHQDLKLIVRETIRCRSIVRGLLDFARQTAPQKTDVDINSSILQVLHMVTNQESFQNIQVETELDPAVPGVLADPDQLRQVFFNIVVNASEAMEGNGHLKILTRWEPGRSHITVHCIDDGPGVPEGTLNRLFDPFFTTKEMGTGLGLAISYGIVNAHRGTLEVKSKPGEGCEVIITLPSDPSQFADA